MQTLILAGGLGTRLRNVVADRPKSMALVNRKPFLEYQIDFLKKYGIDNIVISTGYMSEKIEEHFGTGKNHSISIKYVKEKDLLGTGGAIKNAIPVLEKQFFVLNGDSVFLIDLDAMIKFHEDNRADLTLALAKVKDKSRFGNVQIDEKFRIMEFFEKNNIGGDLISGGIYLFERDNFDWNVFPKKFSIEKDFFPHAVIQKNIFGFFSDSYFIDIGTAEDYEKFGKHLRSGSVLL